MILAITFILLQLWCVGVSVTQYTMHLTVYLQWYGAMEYKIGTTTSLINPNALTLQCSLRKYFVNIFFANLGMIELVHQLIFTGNWLYNTNKYWKEKERDCRRRVGVALSRLSVGWLVHSGIAD